MVGEYVDALVVQETFAVALHLYCYLEVAADLAYQVLGLAGQVMENQGGAVNIFLVVVAWQMVCLEELIINSQEEADFEIINDKP